MSIPPSVIELVGVGKVSELYLLWRKLSYKRSAHDLVSTLSGTHRCRLPDCHTAQKYGLTFLSHNHLILKTILMRNPNLFKFSRSGSYSSSFKQFSDFLVLVPRFFSTHRLLNSMIMLGRVHDC